MAFDIKTPPGKYWLLYYQPLPEAGERIVAALAFTGVGSRPRVEFDAQFVKVRKVFPDTDPQALAFYFEGLAEKLAAGEPFESAINALGPQILASKDRSVANPLTGQILKLLTNRYLMPAKGSEAREKKSNAVAKEIETFVRKSLPPELSLHTNVAARDILGHSVTGTRKIALATNSNGTWTLIDGVDMNHATPREVTDRVNDITKTYWNYSREALKSNVAIRRVGIVLNGNSHLHEKTQEAHDYALHRFAVDSDLAIDAASPGSVQQLLGILAPHLKR